MTEASIVRKAPLAGVRVLDFTRVLSGPHCTRMLQDLGADVIKIEPPSGDLTRFANPRRNGLSTYFVQQNVGKSNLSIDLAQPEGREIVLRLVEHSDVVVENYRPGVMARLGLDAASCMARNSLLVYASISGYGADGPWVHRRAYAPVVEAESGIIRSQGEARDGTFSKDPFSHADVYTALETATAICAALFDRQRHGHGQWVDVSMAETMLYVNEHLHDALWDGPVEPDWIRSFQPSDYLVLTVADGQAVVVSGHPAERGTFDRFLAAMDRADLADDPRFTDVASRLAHLTDLTDEIRAFAATMPDPVAIEERFARHELAVGVIRSSRNLAETDWADERGAIVEVTDRGTGSFRVPNSPWHFSNGPDVGVAGVPKYRGEDNRHILTSILGLDDATIDGLESSGVLSARIPT